MVRSTFDVNRGRQSVYMYMYEGIQFKIKYLLEIEEKRNRNKWVYLGVFSFLSPSLSLLIVALQVTLISTRDREGQGFPTLLHAHRSDWNTEAIDLLEIRERKRERERETCFTSLEDRPDAVVCTDTMNINIRRSNQFYILSFVVDNSPLSFLLLFVRSQILLKIVMVNVSPCENGNRSLAYTHSLTHSPSRLFILVIRLFSHCRVGPLSNCFLVACTYHWPSVAAAAVAADWPINHIIGWWAPVSHRLLVISSRLFHKVVEKHQ